MDCSNASDKAEVIRILHVDDDISVREISKLILTNMGNFYIDSASCVTEAFQKLASNYYDAIVSDYEMPQKDGVEFLKELREQNNEIPFILFAGKGREEVAIKALNLGSDAYINKQGNPETVYGELSDAILKTMERKTAKRLLLESETRYRRLVEESLQGILITQTNPLRLVFANEVIGKILGYTPNELMELSPEKVTGLVHQEDRKIFFERMEKRFRGEPAESFYEFRAIRKDNSTVWLYASANRVDYNGKPAVQGVFLDTTVRKRAEEALVKSEERFSKAFNSGPVAMCISRIADGFLVDVNETYLRLLEFSRKEVVGHTSTELNIYMIPNERATLGRTLQKKGNLSDHETILRTKTGKSINVIASVEKINLDNQHLILSTFIDITQRKKSEEELRKFSLAIQESIDGIIIGEPDGKISYVNDSILKLYGSQDKSDLIGKHVLELIDESDRPKSIRNSLEETKNGQGYLEQFTVVKKDGSKLIVEVATGRIRDENGQNLGFVDVIRNITERKKAEDQRKVLERKVKNYSEHLKCMVELRTAQLEDANKRLVKSERFAAIGELAGMVGHDLRNPLAGIKNATYYLKKKGTTISQAQTKEMIEIIDKAIDHADKIINDLLEYSREMRLELTKYSALTLVNETLETIKVPERIKIVNKVQQEDWIWVNADKMLRVFMNLVKNAIDAMPEEGTLEISSCQRNDCVEIVFADTGTGIPEETMEKLFTPLFTTKAQGMGFGLAICKRIIEAHGGTIKVRTKVNKGTTFIVRLLPPPKR